MDVQIRSSLAASRSECAVDAETERRRRTRLIVEIRATRLEPRPRVSRGRAALALLLATLGHSVVASAQEPPAARESEAVFQERISVLEVEVWVRVERRGEPVRGLGAESFEVVSGGRTLPIVAFEAFDVGRVSEDPVVPDPSSTPEVVSGASGRRFLVVFDVARTSANYLQGSVVGLRAMLEERLHTTDEIAIVLWGSRAASLLHGFTADREVSSAGLDVVEAVLARSAKRQRAALDQLARAMPAGDRAALARQVGLGAALLATDPASLRSLFTGPTAGGFSTDLLREEAGERRSGGGGGQLSGFESVEIQQTIATEVERNRSLGRLVRQISGVPGPRHVLLMAQGFSQFSALILEVQSIFDLVSGAVAPPSYSELLKSFRSLTDGFIAGGWIVSAFDVSGVGGRASGIYPGHDVTDTSSAGFVPFASGNLAGDGSDSLLYLARRTGGDLYDNYSKLDPALDRMLERTDAAYRLVFQLTGEDLESRAVRYDVRLRGGPEAAVLRSAKEYRVMRDDLDSRRDARQIQQRLLGSEEAHGLRASIEVARAPAGVSEPRVVLVIDVPPPSVPAEARALWIQAVSHDAPSGADTLAAGTLHDVWTQVVDLRGESTVPTRLVVFGDLLAPCGGVRLRVRLLLGENGEELRTLRVPSCDVGPFLEALAIRGIDEGSLITHEPGFEPADSESSPLALGGRTFLPATEPVIPTRDALSLLVHARGWRDGARVEVLLVDANDRPVRTGTLKPERLERVGASVRFLTSFPVDRLPTGAYRLLLRWLDGEVVRGADEVELEMP